jgi:hypothetical protein
MNPKLPLLALVCLVAIPAPATVVVYKLSQTAQYIGQEQTLRISATGYVVLDTDTLKGFDISVYNARGTKFFTVSPFEEDTRQYTVTGTGGHVYTAFVVSAVTNRTSQFDDNVEFTIGVNTALAVSPTNTVSLPRVLKGVFGGISIPTGAPGVALYGTGTASYSNTDSRLANSKGETTADTLARYRSLLANRGYQEISQ